jgi:hypothetical protein
MKKLLTVVILVVASFKSFSQSAIPPDTIVTESRTFIGNMEYFKNGILYNDTLISIDSVKEAFVIIPSYSKETAFKESEFIGYRVDKNYKISSEAFNDNKFKSEISKSGAFGVSAAVFLFTGNIINVVSIFKPSVPLSVTGISLSTIGVSLLIPTFTTLKNSKNKKIYIY